MSHHMLCITSRKPLAIAGVLRDDGRWTTVSMHNETDFIGRTLNFIVWLATPTPEMLWRAQVALFASKGKMHWQCEEPA